MKKISMKEFASLLETDEALRARIAACPDEAAARETAMGRARGLGYELTETPVAGKQALTDDDLSSVAGGRNPFLIRSDGELNPYSWFVTLLRSLLQRGDGNEDLSPLESPPPKYGRGEDGSK